MAVRNGGKKTLDHASVGPKADKQPWALLTLPWYGRYGQAVTRLRRPPQRLV